MLRTRQVVLHFITFRHSSAASARSANDSCGLNSRSLKNVCSSFIPAPSFPLPLSFFPQSPQNRTQNSRLKFRTSSTAEEEDEDNMEEIDTDNIIDGGRRTRGKRIDFAKAAAENPAEDDDDDEDDDEDFQAKGEDDADAMQE